MAFITNFQSPVELDDLIERFEYDGLTNIDFVLNASQEMGDWTVDKGCSIGETVFFMCAKTSAAHMGHVCAEARRLGNPDLLSYAEEEREKYKRYAGTVMAVGKVMSDPFQADSGYVHAYWKSPWYAEIGNFYLLRRPVSIDEFRDFIKVSRTGAITRLDTDQALRLYDLILFCNLE